VEELIQFLGFPSVSEDPAAAGDVRACASWLARRLRAIGMEGVRVVPTRGHPFVSAEWRGAPGRPTVLIYGHYDVQPPGPPGLWRSPPFRPTRRGDRLVARGASDDKGQLFTHVKAVESYLGSTGALPVNVRCVFDGEEEIGSPALVELLANHPSRLAADVALVSDTRFLAPGRPAITTALRGLFGCRVTVRAPMGERHAGHFGGAVRNPLEVLCSIIGRLHDDRGRAAIPGFYERVRSRPKHRVDAAPPMSEAKRPGLLNGWGEPGYTPLQRVTVRPAVSVTSVAGGSGRAAIPGAASAHLDVRLVPDQDPNEIGDLLRRYILESVPAPMHASLGATVRVSPVVIDPRHRMLRAAARAYVRGFGIEPALVRSGGTIPIVSALDRTLHIPIVLMGFGMPDDNIHGPNEKLDLPNLFGGIETSIAFLEEVASA
jgi:acetylornithine deacetylase/succinyl-diaminopimelate desuccinylase-like protein